MPELLEAVNRLANASEQKIREVDVVTTAFRSVLAQEYTYVSTPITSGALLYEALRRSGKRLPEFMADRKALVEEVIKPNVERAVSLSHRLVPTLGGAIISPAIFEAKGFGWGQDEYMALWLRIINEQVTRIVMLDGWEYSNGAVEEYIESFLMQHGYRARSNIEIVREDGSPLTVEEAFERIVEAAFQLLPHGSAAARVVAESMHRMQVASNRDFGLTPQERRIRLPQAADQKASAFLGEFPELLYEVDPAFVVTSHTGRLQHLRHQFPLDAHLMRRREALPDEVRLTGFEPDEGA